MSKCKHKGTKNFTCSKCEKELCNKCAELGCPKHPVTCKKCQCVGRCK